MRWLRIILVILVVGLGLTFGALNDGDVRIDFHVVSITLSAGTALLAAALMGALCAGFCLWLAVIWPLQRRLRRAQRAEQRAVGTALEPVDQDPA